MRQWAEAAIGRRQLARGLRRLTLLGFEIRDVLGHGDSAQQSDRLLVGPHGVYLVGFHSPPGNAWRSERIDQVETIAARAQATHRLAEIVSAGLTSELSRLSVRIHPLITIVGPEQERGALIVGLPLLGPAGLCEHVTAGAVVLSAMQVGALMDRADDWLARRSVINLQQRIGHQGGGRRRRPGSL